MSKLCCKQRTLSETTINISVFDENHLSERFPPLFTKPSTPEQQIISQIFKISWQSSVGGRTGSNNGFLKGKLCQTKP